MYGVLAGPLTNELSLVVLAITLLPSYMNMCHACARCYAVPCPVSDGVFLGAITTYHYHFILANGSGVAGRRVPPLSSSHFVAHLRVQRPTAYQFYLHGVGRVTTRGRSVDSM